MRMTVIEASEHWKVTRKTIDRWIDADKLKMVINNTLEVLDNRERGIIECYFGLNRDCEPVTLEAVGDRYGLTKERIRQIKYKAVRKLRDNNEELYLLLNR